MAPPALPGLFAESALLPDGWVRNVSLRFAAGGTIESVSTGADGADLPRAAGPVLPGAVNAHSHAFQRALVGRVQRLSPEDDFWSWRERMIRLVGVLGPEDVEAVSLRCYRDLLLHGYTSVAEFHYLHRDANLSLYAEPAELSLRIVAAARGAGIGLTLLPVLYRRSGFDGGRLEGPKARFGLYGDEFDRVLDRLESERRLVPFTLGLAPHSLRSVSRSDLDELAPRMRPGVPVHVHVAEQVAEVDGCRDATGLTPVRWLFRHTAVTDDWTFVHATHADADEYVTMREAGVVAALCPTTEGDLGDGLFPFAEWVAGGGRFAVGSDSQVSVSAGEELRALLYRARISELRRGVPSPAPTLGHGTALWRAAAEHGAAAIGRRVGRIEVGAAADLVVLDASNPLLEGLSPDEAGCAFVQSGSAAEIERVVVAGRTVVERGRHVDDERIRREWSAAAKRIAAALS